MSQRQDKKMRRFFRQQFQKEYYETARKIAERDMNMFRTKPRWVPLKVWTWLISIFIKVK
jgi:hypothetical protein